MFHTRRGLGHLGLALVFTGAAACGQPDQAKPIDFTANGFDGFEDTRFNILSTTCEIPTVTTTVDPIVTAGYMYITLAEGETGYLFLRASDGYVVSNAAQADGSECKILASSLTGATGKKIIVRGTDGASNQKLIIDFYNGLWAQAATASAAITTTNNAVVQVNFSYLSSGTESILGASNEVKIRGTAGADYFVFTTPSGQTGGEPKQFISYLSASSGLVTTPTVAPAVRGANLADVSLKHVDLVKVSTGPGTDIISPLGLAGTTTVAPNALRGGVSFTAWGGDDNDTLYSGAASLDGAANSLFGGLGNDRFIQSSFCSKDIIDGEAGTSDTVDYSAKTAALNVTVASPSVGVTGVAATGTLTCATKANTLNNEKFTLDDGTNTPTVFEFKKAKAIASITVVSPVQAEGDSFSLSDGTSTNTFVFDAGTLTTQVAPNYAIDITSITAGSPTSAVIALIESAIDARSMGFATTASAGTLYITKTAAGAFSYTIPNTSTGGTITYANFSGGAAFTATANTTPVDLSDLLPLATASEVCAVVASAINGVVGGLDIGTASSTSPLPLVNGTAGVAGNTVSNETVAHASFILTDMEGGVAAYVFAEDDGDTTCNTSTTEGDDIKASVENVIGGAGADTINASKATGVGHILVGMGGDDTLTGADDLDKLYGGLGNDTLKGGAGVDNLYGGDGNDTLQPGLGDDFVYGGTLASTENCPVAAVLAIASPGTACANVASSGVNALDFSDRAWGAGVTCSLANACTLSAGVLVPHAETCGTTSGTVQHVAWNNIANLTGGAGADTLTGNDSANTIKGGSGIDNIMGMGGNDTIYGEAGNDTIYGGNATSDPLPLSCVGAACTTDNDFISGGLGLDSMYGGLGNDFIDANDGDPDLVINCGSQDADIGVTDPSGDVSPVCAL